MAEVLRLAQLVQHNRVAEWMSGAVGSSPSLIRSGVPRGQAAPDLGGELGLDEEFVRAAAEDVELALDLGRRGGSGHRVGDEL